MIRNSAEFCWGVTFAATTTACDRPSPWSMLTNATTGTHIAITPKSRGVSSRDSATTETNCTASLTTCDTPVIAAPRAAWPRNPSGRAGGASSVVAFKCGSRSTVFNLKANPPAG